MFRQLFIVLVLVLVGGFWAYQALTSFPVLAGLLVGALIFGGTLMILGAYVAHQDPRRRSIRRWYESEFSGTMD